MNFLERRVRKLEKDRKPEEPVHVQLVVFGDGPLPEPRIDNNVHVTSVRFTDLQKEQTT